MAATKKTTKKKATKKVVEKTTFMGFINKCWEFDKKILNFCWNFLIVGDIYSYTVGVMGLWLVFAAIANIF